jgi:1-aminocyclopropane-1-carboxylate deaminase/D-cysteine desulfhydrase-like pyridoxal-dependent ACC family enzyme
MSEVGRALDELPRQPLATLPTPLEPGGSLPDGRRLFVKRDDLTGLGMGGNKARKLEFLTAQALIEGADVLVTVGAGQSNHARMTAAAGARLGVETHLVLGGGRPDPLAGNQLLSSLFGARLHHHATDDWGELTEAMDELVERWRAEGRTPYAMPIGGSTPLGAMGFVAAWRELLEQCATTGVRPGVVVHATSSGGTHAGMLAGRHLLGGPPVLAIAVAQSADELAAVAGALADAALERLGAPQRLDAGDVRVEDRYLGEAYGVPTAAGDAGLRWAARRGGWVLDRVYTAKALGGLLGELERGALPPGDVVFWHTGGQPSVFAPGGAPTSASPSVEEPPAP